MADTFAWTTPGTSGTYNVASEWTDLTNPGSGLAPGAADTADLTGATGGTPQTVTGPGSAARLNVSGLNILSGVFLTDIASIDGLTAASLELMGSLSASGGLIVGNSGNGTLSEQSSTISASSGDGTSQVVIGNVAGASGSVTIGTQGALTLNGPAEDTNYGLVVGNSGTGALLVTGSAASVTDANDDGVVVGYGSGSVGSLIVNSGGSASFGSIASNTLAAVAVGRAGNGVLTVDGAGSTLSANGGVYVGRGAAGGLTVSNGAVFAQTAAGTYVEIGDGSSSSTSHIGGTGAGTVESHGTLSDAGYLRVGGFGVSGALTVETGGFVSATASSTASAIAVGEGGTIDGVFYGGTGSLEIDAGSTVEVAGPASPGVAGVSVAGGTGETNGTVDVTGAGAVLNAGSNLIVVGSVGNGVMNVTDGGAITAASPGTGYGAIVVGNSGGAVGILTVSGIGSTATANGPLTVGYNGIGTLDIFDGGQVGANNANVGAGSEIRISGSSTLTVANGIVLATGAAISGSGTIDGGVAGNGTIVATGGTLTLAGTAEGGALNIAADGDLVLGGGVPGLVDVTFLSGASGRLDLNPFSFGGIVNVVDAGDSIVAAGATSIGFTGGNLIELLDSSHTQIGTIQLGANYAQGQVVDNDGTITIACFATGTRIATQNGAVAVEALRVGDLVALANGGTAPIVWVGHRRVECARHPRPWDVMPVRVHAHAFGPGQPHADLLLSPDHAVFVDGHLIPIRYLLNGATIVQQRVEAITYWHVELPRHAVLLAEGLPAESFLDTGNRDAFADTGPTTQLHPDFSRGVWAAEACAPLSLDGPRVVAAKQALLDRAVTLGHVPTEDSGLLLTADGRTLAVETDGRQWRATLPPGAQTVRLISRTWTPAHTRAEESDTRTLGVALSRLWLNRRDLALDSAGLTVGWHKAEAEWRWTDGAAEVPVAGLREIAFTLAVPGLYWRDAHLREMKAA